MKKLFCIMIALAIMVGAVGCVDISTDEDIRQPVADGTADNSDDAAASNNNSETKPADDVSISQTVLLDEAGVKITAKSIDTDSFLGAELTLLIENNTEKDITIQTRNTVINGFMVESSLSASVAAGKKANDAITFLSTSLEASGISDIAQIEIYFHIFETDTWETYYDSEMISIETSIADSFDYSFDFSGITVYEGNGVTVIAKGISDNNSIFGPGLVLYILNGSSKSVTVQTRDVSANGFMVTSVFSSEILPGKAAIDALTFFESELEQNGIEKITELELSLHIFDSESWKTIVDTDKVTLNFE